MNGLVLNGNIVPMNVLDLNVIHTKFGQMYNYAYSEYFTYKYFASFMDSYFMIVDYEINETCKGGFRSWISFFVLYFNIESTIVICHGGLGQCVFTYALEINPLPIICSVMRITE